MKLIPEIFALYPAEAVTIKDIYEPVFLTVVIGQKLVAQVSGLAQVVGLPLF
jgi:hypothetical protein